jgi:hypothetical protein
MAMPAVPLCEHQCTADTLSELIYGSGSAGRSSLYS